MKAYWATMRDGAVAFEPREVAKPQPQPGSLLIKVEAAGLNRGEVMVGSVTQSKEKVGGIEAAGVVEAVGEGVTAFRPGDKVMGPCGGGFAEYAVMNAGFAIPVPASLPWEAAGATPVGLVTAYEATMRYGKLTAGDWMLVTGASAGVAVAAFQIARFLGAKSIGTSGSAAKLEALRAVGLDVGIETRAPDFAEQVREVTDGGADLALNLVGGSMFAECIRSLGRQGRLAIIGYIDSQYHADFDLAAVHANRLEIFGLSNSRRTPAERSETIAAFTKDIVPALADGRIKPLVDKVFPFAELPAALEYVYSNAMIGKVVVRM